MKTTIRHWQIKIAVIAFAASFFFIELSAQKSYSVVTAGISLKQLKEIYIEIMDKKSGLIAMVASSANMPGDIKVDEAALHAGIEEHIIIEPWMLDELHFMGVSNRRTDLKEELEQPVAIEEWMLDISHFLPKKETVNLLQQEEEEALHVEDWMLNAAHFNTGTTTIR
ncbi:MAG: hypothetical protein JXB00_18860 [Bacteroidales bacterium]|nr:hypothetical protein [Bacteroidales bacterium]